MAGEIRPAIGFVISFSQAKNPMVIINSFLDWLFSNCCHTNIEDRTIRKIVISHFKRYKNEISWKTIYFMFFSYQFITL